MMQDDSTLLDQEYQLHLFIKIPTKCLKLDDIMYTYAYVSAAG